MRKFTIYNLRLRNKGKLRLQFTIFFLIFVLYILHFTFYIPNAFALDSTGSASLTTGPSADIRSKLEELKKEIASRAAKLKGEINKKLTDKAYIGKVTTKSKNSITVATKNGPRLVSINADSEFESKTKQKSASWRTVSEEDFVAALGDVDETGVLTARKIILLKDDMKLKTYLWGQVIAISDKLATLKDRNLKNIAVSMDNPSNIKLRDFVILTGTVGKNNFFDTDFVYVIPQGGILKPKKIYPERSQWATPSALQQK